MSISWIHTKNKIASLQKIYNSYLILTEGEDSIDKRRSLTSGASSSAFISAKLRRESRMKPLRFSSSSLLIPNRAGLLSTTLKIEIE